jgi:erythromycin esterase-like protein
MPLTLSAETLDQLSKHAKPLSGAPADYDPLLHEIGDAPYVLLGEASHGTHEFYKARAEITKRLIVEKGFTVIAWEADWPDALRVNRYIRARGDDQTAAQALQGFTRFPTWMWRNADILDLVGWLPRHNEMSPPSALQVGVYGLDLYSLHASMDAVVRYLEKVDPQAAREARRRYACFEDFGGDPESYGLTAGLTQTFSCEEEVVRQLVELQRKAAEFLSRDGRIAADELFFAEQNARAAKNAERCIFYQDPVRRDAQADETEITNPDGHLERLSRNKTVGASN